MPEPDAQSDGTAQLRTFLIADMRGYTAFTRANGDEAASVLAGRFAAIVRSTVETRDGRLVELRGDEAMCVFFSARQALRAAVDLQRGLRAARTASERFPLGVGIGLDAGEAVPTAGGYRGSALNLAARLCGIASAGEILASDAVVHLAQRVEGLSFVPARPVRLKGFERPVRHAKVVSDDPLPPPPTPPTTRRGRSWWPAITVTGLVAAAAVAAAVIHDQTAGQRLARAAARIAPANSLVSLNPHTGMIEHVTHLPLAGEPARLAAGDGRVWTYNGDTQTVYGINTRTYQSQAIGVGLTPSDIATTPGHVWIADPYTNSLMDIDSRSPDLRTRIRLDNSHGMGFSGNFRIATKPDQVWVTQSSGWLVVDARTDKPISRHHVPPTQLGPGDVALAGNQIWFILAGHPGRVEEVRPTHGTVSVPSLPTCCPPEGDLGLGFGYAWYAAGYRLWKISPAPVAVEDTIPINGDGESIAIGAGAVWVGDAATGAVLRINPTTDTFKRFKIGKSIGGITVANGRVWATVQG
jgi:class 3 adenylate cyclase/streptogramin lyase